MKFFIGISLWLLPLWTNAQEIYAIVGIDGLHCSACLLSTEKSLKKNDFIDEIKMDLEKRVAEVSFRAGKKIILEEIAQRVVDAGFSVRNVILYIEGQNNYIQANGCFEYKGWLFDVREIKENSGQERMGLMLLGEKFMSKKDFKSWKNNLAGKCSQSQPNQKMYPVIVL